MQSAPPFALPASDVSPASSRPKALSEAPRAPISYIASASRCAESGLYRLSFADADDLETRADLMVAFSVEKGLADLDYIVVEHVHTTDRARCAAITEWVRTHETAVFRAAMEVSL